MKRIKAVENVNSNSMTTKLFDITGWDIKVENDFFYFQRMDEFGKNQTYHKSDLTTIWTISENEFNEIKYGLNYKKNLQLLEQVNLSVKLLDDSVVWTGYTDSFFYFIDNKRNITNKREDLGFDSIYSFDIDKNGNIWYAIPTAHYVGLFSLNKSEEIFHLGEKYEDEKPLSLPEDIKAYGNHAYISDMGNHRIIQLNIGTKEWTEYLKFDEPVWEYRQFQGKELVRLKSGIHLIEK